MPAMRSNPDDVYYVNLSQWVTDHGTFPLRDTIFANLVYPMSSWPPMASYDALMGTVARLAHVRAAAVVYIVAPPIVTLLSVLAMWRLLRAWQVKSVSIALSSALVFLLLDGASPHAPGTLFVSRLWQAKVVFLCLMVPVLLMYAVRYVERPDRERAGWLFVGGVAAVGVEHFGDVPGPRHRGSRRGPVGSALDAACDGRVCGHGGVPLGGLRRDQGCRRAFG